MIEQLYGGGVLDDGGALPYTPFGGVLIGNQWVFVELDIRTFNVLGDGESYLVMVTVPTVYAEVGHNPVVGFPFIGCFEFADVGVADVAVVPAAFRGFDNLCAGLPYVAFLRRDAFIQINIVHYLERVAVLADEPVADAVLVLDNARSIIIVSCATAELIPDLRCECLWAVVVIVLTAGKG